MSSNLMLLASQVMKTDELIREIKKGIAQFESGETDKGINNIKMYAMLLLSKEVVEHKGLSAAIKDLEEITQIRDRLNSKTS